jgi:hypothetical protein
LTQGKLVPRCSTCRSQRSCRRRRCWRRCNTLPQATVADPPRQRAWRPRIAIGVRLAEAVQRGSAVTESPAEHARPARTLAVVIARRAVVRASGTEVRDCHRRARFGAGSDAPSASQFSSCRQASLNWLPPQQ